MSYKKLSPSPVVEGGTGAQTLTGVLTGNGTSAITANTITQYGTVVAGASNAVSSVSPSATSGIPYVSGGSSANPSFTTAVVAGGGTGQTSFTAYAPILAGATSTTALAQATANLNTAGYVLTANGSGAPTFQAAAGGGITTIDGTSGSATGSTVTLTGSTSGAVFTASGATVTESFNYLALPTTTSTNGLVSINGSAFMHNMNGGTFLGVGAGNLTSIPGTVTAIGSGAAPINTSSDGHIVAVGDNAMHANTAGGFGVYIGSNAGYYPTGDFCTAVGYGALQGNVSNAGSYNTAIGESSLNGYYGSYTTALGWQSFLNLKNGNDTIGIGANAGLNHTGAESFNIMIGSRGVTGESNVLRIADGNGTSDQQLIKAFISGIAGITTVVADAVPVLISASTGQLGTVTSSIRYKENIQDMADVSSGLLNLRPVTFDYIDKPNHKRQVGLIAEEVYEVMPDLVVKVNGEIETVKYQDLSVLLLNELQKAVKRIEALEAQLKG